ncbi:MAG: xanthine dehydrogenase, partial [Candidatus Neomarinimicrobiota bacterium]
LTLPQLTWAYPVYSRVPFGRIRSIDWTPARSVAGFLGFFGAGQVPGTNQVGVIVPDQPLFAADTVRYVGDTIGLVVAETEAAAREAAGRVQVTIDPLPPVFTIEEAKASTGPFLHETNQACRHRVVKGDLAAGFAAADVIVEATLTTGWQEHFYLEPQGCIAIPREQGRFQIRGSIQCPYYVQKAVAVALGLAYSQVWVEPTPLGGAFGGKEDVPSELCARAAVAAYHLRRPVRLQYDRELDIQLTSKRHPFRMQYKIGARHDGTLTAAEVVLEENAGAYATLSSVVSYRASIQCLGPYRIPHVHVDSIAYYTNTPPTGAFRGFGSPQAAFGHERMLDLVARRLQLDPVDVRRKNLLQPGDQTSTGQRLETSVGAADTLDLATRAAGWTHFTPVSSGRYRTGLGVSTIHYGNCLGAAGWALDGAGAKIALSRDGSVAVAYGLVDMGQGAITVVQQMTAEALGVRPERVTVLPTDSRQVPDSGPSVASRNVVMTGQAIRNAAEQLLPSLKRAAARLLDTDPDAVTLADDEARDTRSGQTVPFEALTEQVYLSNGRLESLGWWHVPPLRFDPDTGLGEAYFMYSFATHVAHVTVDTLTGKVKVERVWAAHDVGRAIHPAGIEGQVEGGVVQGLGWALTERLVQRDGTILTANASTYLLPTAADSPPISTYLVEAEAPDGPWGAKGIGEPAIIPTAAAIANAVSAAIGRPIHTVPITPEVVLRALEEA